jgi:GT2 family glycosyltransferase
MIILFGHNKTVSMDLSIIIVNYQSVLHLGRCLNSVFSAFLPVQFEIIVANNDPPEVGADIRDTFGQKVILIQNPRNLGFAEANRIAISKAQGRYILLLNPDTIVEKEAIWRLFCFLEKNRDYGAAGPQIFLSNGSIQLEGGRNFPSLKYAVFEIFLLRRVWPDIFGGLRLENWNHDSSRDVPCLLGAAMFLRRSTLEDIGGLDASLPMYLEDMDLCYRIWRSGSRIYYLKDARIVHVSGQSSARAAPLRRAGLQVMELCQANYLFFKKHKGNPYAQIYRLIVFSGAMFRITVIPILLGLGKVWKLNRNDFSVYTLHKYLGFLKWSITLKAASLD